MNDPPVNNDRGRARYDGIAAWYDGIAQGSMVESEQALTDLLGPGTGLCLDLGCGTGLYFDTIRRTGRTPIGVDVSSDQLGLARQRSAFVVQGDASRLPFANDTFQTAAAIWISTDVDDFGAVGREVARTLQPGGLFVLFGVHPCFNGPCVESREDGARVVHPTYRVSARHHIARWWGRGGIRERVGGMWHIPLGELLNAIIDAGLRIAYVAEPREDPIPAVLALRAYKDTTCHQGSGPRQR
ncbi:class I SAM-dependent methyltransferase [Jiangella asiatica]|uniref:Class I SAM-dependent methyltransferase n=1 Tax=Jiangella asiatica TaxID=2530372 RepID=A0A4R5DKW8_9ACTN|nr:class I SAM-dependent methyltransferase [Jiangella asiatica]TDE12644.1 class I SAM-dependent methyltransferase [Jiangella asiatica]